MVMRHGYHGPRCRMYCTLRPYVPALNALTGQPARPIITGASNVRVNAGVRPARRRGAPVAHVRQRLEIGI